MALVPTIFHANTIRNLIIAFGSEFKAISVDVIKPGTATIIRTIDPVPLQFGPMEKEQILEKRVHPDENQRYYEKLPKMALTWTSINYNGERARGVDEHVTYYTQNTKLSDATEFIKNVNPTPYDFGFELEIRTQKLNQFTQILESILPYYNATRYLRVKEFSFLNVERDLKVKLDGISPDFLQEQIEDDRRYVNGTLSFTVEGFLYLPLTNTKVIKEIRTRYYPSYTTGTSALSATAMAGYNTSGWDSSATFPEDYDSSGTAPGGTSGDFDYYIENMVDNW